MAGYQRKNVAGAAGSPAPVWWRQRGWRRAPGVLIHHASAFAALAVAGFLVTVAVSSAPFVTTASASAALKDKLDALSPLATGLQIGGTAGGSTPTKALRDDNRRRAAARQLQRALGL